MLPLTLAPPVLRRREMGCLCLRNRRSARCLTTPYVPPLHFFTHLFSHTTGSSSSPLSSPRCTRCSSSVRCARCSSRLTSCGVCGEGTGGGEFVQVPVAPVGLLPGGPRQEACPKHSTGCPAMLARSAALKCPSSGPKQAAAPPTKRALCCSLRAMPTHQAGGPCGGKGGAHARPGAGGPLHWLRRLQPRTLGRWRTLVGSCMQTRAGWLCLQQMSGGANGVASDCRHPAPRPRHAHTHSRALPAPSSPAVSQ